MITDRAEVRGGPAAGEGMSLFIYYGHLCNGNKCFRHNCPSPEYVDCLHPATKAIIKGKIEFVEGVVLTNCHSCQYKLAQATEHLLRAVEQEAKCAKQ